MNLLHICVLWITFILGNVGSSRGFLFKSPSGLIPPPKIESGILLPPELWFTQFLDHFNPTDSRVWQQKYFINDTFYEDGGPIFLMIGGEGPASVNWMVNGSWITYGRKYKALLVQLEHRFYGKSHPTPDLSVESLQYLSSEQALADLAYFIVKFKEEKNLTANKVIAFGGSYPGSLSAWFRLKYPHLVHASVSSSAPLVAQINFQEYLDVVTASIQTKGNKRCIQQISKATQYVNLLLQHRVGWKTLGKLFRLCSPLDGLNQNDVSNLFEMLAESFEDVVQYNEDNRAFEGVKGTNVTISTLCDIMNDESLGNPLERYASVNSLRLKISEEKCLDHSYKSMISELRKSEWSNETSPGGRQWMYQTCTEFGFYQTSDSPNQPFGKNFSLDFFVQQCSDIFGERFTYELLQRGVERSNIIYGGKAPKVSRVVLVNGSIDPWHYLGATQDLNEDAPAIFINGTAHCANMYPERPSDLPQLTEARDQIENLIGKWIMED